MAKSIKKRIDELVTKLGELPPPSTATIKGNLIKIGVLVEALEEGAAIREAEAKTASLEAALEKSDAESANLKVELQKANAELETFRAERKKQQEKEREIPPIQLEILKRLPSEHGGGLRMDQIARALKIELDETELYVLALEKAGFVASRYGELDTVIWHRTADGNKLVVAKRWAGEENGKKTYKHADLPQIQHEALVMIGSDPSGANENEIAQKVGASLLLTRNNLRQLRKAGMATDGDEPQATYGTGEMWWILEKGEEYLAERNLL